MREWFRHGSDGLLILFATITSLFLSVWVGYQDAVINPDGICYLLSAQQLETGRLHDVISLCPQSRWPFYSILIFSLAKLSHLSYFSAAVTINAVLSLFTVLAFIGIVKLLGGTKRILWLAAFVILFAHQLNVLRDNVIRDHGFWAFYLASLFCLLLYVNHKRWWMAIAFQASLVIATLFRIEGAVFLILLPFVTLFTTNTSMRERARLFFTLNLPLIFAGFVGLVWLQTSRDFSQLGRVQELIQQVQNGYGELITRYDAIRNVLLQQILPIDGAADASALVITSWIGWYLYNVVITMSTSYSILVSYAWICQRRFFSTNSIAVLSGYLIINVLITLIFLAEHLFISKRYLIALSLTLMLWIPFAIDNLIAQWPSMRHRIFLIIMTAGLIVTGLSGVIGFGQSKVYVRTAGQWVDQNVPTQASLYVNDYQLMYYTNHFGVNIFTKLPVYLQTKDLLNGGWKNYDYLALKLTKNNQGEMAALLTEMQHAPIQIFKNKRGNYVAIYQIQHEENVK